MANQIYGSSDWTTRGQRNKKTFKEEETIKGSCSCFNDQVPDVSRLKWSTRTRCKHSDILEILRLRLINGELLLSIDAAREHIMFKHLFLCHFQHDPLVSIRPGGWGGWAWWWGGTWWGGWGSCAHPGSRRLGRGWGWCRWRAHQCTGRGLADQHLIWKWKNIS